MSKRKQSCNLRSLGEGRVAKLEVLGGRILDRSVP